MKRVCLIAGSGNLPLEIYNFCKNNNINIFIILIKDFANKNIFPQNITSIELNIGQIRKVLKFLKQHNLKEIVFAGGIKKPSLFSLKTDFTGWLLLQKILKNKLFGDDNLLKTIINFFEKKGIIINNVNNYLEKNKFIFGFNSHTSFKDNEFYSDIELGKNILKELSKYDIGQSIIIQQKTIIAIEGIEGTEKLICRSNDIKFREGRGAILIKLKKDNQTDRIDLPAIGPDTIEQMKKNGLVGIALDYKNCIIIDKFKVIELANKYNIFIYGIEN